MIKPNCQPIKQEKSFCRESRCKNHNRRANILGTFEIALAEVATEPDGGLVGATVMAVVDDWLSKTRGEKVSIKERKTFDLKPK